jgi:hypothetical protein
MSEWRKGPIALWTAIVLWKSPSRIGAHIADDFKDDQVKHSVYRLVDDYERMAEFREVAVGMKNGEHVH